MPQASAKQSQFSPPARGVLKETSRITPHGVTTNGTSGTCANKQSQFWRACQRPAAWEPVVQTNPICRSQTRTDGAARRTYPMHGAERAKKSQFARRGHLPHHYNIPSFPDAERRCGPGLRSDADGINKASWHAAEKPYCSGGFWWGKPHTARARSSAEGGWATCSFEGWDWASRFQGVRSSAFRRVDKSEPPSSVRMYAAWSRLRRKTLGPA